MTAAREVDAIVVGAGPAGLACAVALAGRRVLLLDRERRHGGRIRTLDLGGQRVDLGACFAFDPAAVPAGLVVDAGRLIEERAELALHDGTRTHAAATPMGCLLRMGVDAESLRRVSRVARLEADSTSLQGSRAAALLDALMHQVHPGDLLEYAPRHWRDGLFSWFPDHWEHGNASLADALLAGSGADFLPGAEATRVVDRGGRVEVVFTHDGRERQASARAAVLATSADVAARLIGPTDPRVRRFLEATRYAGYLVVAMAGMAAATLGSFRCLIPLHGRPAAIVQQRSHDRRLAVLLSYFRGPDGLDLARRSDPEIVELCRSRLESLGIARSALDALDACAVQRWPQGGTILSEDYLRSRAQAAAVRTGRVVLAGDYACGESGVGYGVADAMRSGLRAAASVRALL